MTNTTTDFTIMGSTYMFSGIPKKSSVFYITEVIDNLDNKDKDFIKSKTIELLLNQKLGKVLFIM